MFFLIWLHYLAERDTICSNPSATIRLGSRAGMKQISGGHSPLMASAKFPRLVGDQEPKSKNIEEYCGGVCVCL